MDTTVCDYNSATGAFSNCQYTGQKYYNAYDVAVIGSYGYV